MSDNDTNDESTRRDYLKYGGAVVGGGLLAGCAGQSDSGSTSTSTETATNSTASTETETKATSEGESSSVTMSPVGKVEFDSAPQSAVAFDDQWADILVALGREDSLEGLGRPESFYQGYYDQLPGVSLDTDSLTPLFANESSYDKELLYELSPDVFHMDPLRAVQTNDNFDREDVDEVVENVAPWFANRFSVYHNYDGDEPYEYYSVFELTQKFAEVYKETDRSAALREIYETMLADIESRLPPEEERPSVAVTFYSDGTFYAQPPLNNPGIGRAQYRIFGAKDAYEEYPDQQSFGGSHAMELMLEIDPDVIIQTLSLTPPHLIDPVRNGEVTGASDLTAVQEGRVYNGTTPFQGPIFTLFQTEAVARQLYPDEFGEFQGFDEPVPGNERLFDRQRVADIINGDS